MSKCSTTEYLLCLNYLLILAGIRLTTAHEYIFRRDAISKRDYCNSTTVDPTPECWDELGITQYIKDWWDQHKSECNSFPYQNDGFASCYQQKHQILDYSCGNVSVDPCYHPTYSDNENLTVTEYYVLQSISNVWTWYNSIYHAVIDGTFLADLRSGAILDTIKGDMAKDEIPLPGTIPLGALLSLLSAGLALVGFPAAGIGARAFATVLHQAPGLGKTLTSTKGLEGQVTTLDKLGDSLGVVLGQSQQNLAEALWVTQSNADYFIGHTANGSFVGDTPSQVDLTKDFARVLYTYIISQALRSHNVIITVAEGLNPHDLWKDTKTWHETSHDPKHGAMLPQNSYHVNCQNPPDQFGVCSNWWVSDGKEDLNVADQGPSAYALFKLDDPDHNFYDLMETMFSNDWTSGHDLFIGARSCSHGFSLGTYGFSKQESATHFPLVNSLTLQSQCYSNLRYCIWNQTNNLTNQDGSEFMLPTNQNQSGCAFAWPNLCVNGTGISTEAPTLNLTADQVPQEYEIFNNNTRHGIGTAGVWFETNQDIDNQILTRGFQTSSNQYPAALLAYNGVYDPVNTPPDTLQALANNTDPRTCSNFPDDVNSMKKLPGWGGSGYRNGHKCRQYPASYLGPGLYFNYDLCKRPGV